jgi:hypothetical protein
MEDFEWTGLKVKIIVRNEDGYPKLFTATIEEFDDQAIVFTDKFNVTYFFPREAIVKMQQIPDEVIL